MIKPYVDQKYLYFSASWCIPCKSYAPVLERLPIEFGKVDVEEHPELVEKYGISSVPTIVDTETGKTIVGTTPDYYLMEILK